MLERYSLPEMTRIWSEQFKLQTWFRIEVLACEGRAKLGELDGDIVKAFWAIEPETFDEQRIKQIEAEVNHESVAFQMYIEELADEKCRGIFHWGLTSSDVLDTCYNYQLKEATDLIIAKLQNLAAEFKRLAQEHKFTPCIGRSHGIHGEPITFGLKMLRAYAETQRNISRLEQAKREISVGMISGAMGTYSTINPEVEKHVCKQMGLETESISSQIIPRDRHAMYFTILGVVAATLERISTELRQLQITEIGEIQEPFSSRQKGSSAMPHKKNPILLENITGLSRLIQTHVSAALGNVSLWQERDMSHSSVERALGPDTTITLDFAIHRLTGLLKGLVVNSQQMASNLEKLGGTVYSHRIMNTLTERGVPKDDAYRMVQSASFRAIESGGNLLEVLLRDRAIMNWISQDELADLFDLKYFQKEIEGIYERVLEPGNQGAC